MRLAGHVDRQRPKAAALRRHLLLAFACAALASGVIPDTASAATPAEPACGSNATPSISLDIPNLVADGPDSVRVYGYQNDSVTGDNGVVAGTMTVSIYSVSVTPAQLVQSVDVPASNDPSSDTEESLLGDFTPEPLGDSLEVVATYETSYTDYATYPSSEVPCDQAVTATTSIEPGLPPKVAFGRIHVRGNGEELVFRTNPANDSCYSQLGGWTQRTTSYLSETWTLGRKRWQMFLTPCYKRAPFRTPPGILAFNASKTSTAIDPDGYELWLGALAPRGNFFRARYQFVVAFNHHTLYSGPMTTYYKYTPGYRVYQATDAFVNYCINGGHKTYSSNLVLYCNHPAQTVAYVRLS